jgi:hypothetical protein
MNSKPRYGGFLVGDLKKYLYLKFFVFLKVFKKFFYIFFKGFFEKSKKFAELIGIS